MVSSGMDSMGGAGGTLMPQWYNMWWCGEFMP